MARKRFTKAKKTKKASKGASKKINRISTGIPGLDPLIKGGFVAGSTNLIAGGTGTGKTIFCMQFLMEGLRNGEKCLFVTLEESPGDILEDAAVFGWDFGKYVDKKQLYLEYMDPFDLTSMTKGIISDLKRHKLSRVVIDSTSAMGLYFKDPFEVRKQLFKVLSALKNSGATTVITAESPGNSALTRFGVEEFVTDGVIIMRSLGVTGELGKSLTIKKMRRTGHDENIHPLKVTSQGLKVFPASKKRISF